MLYGGGSHGALHSFPWLRSSVVATAPNQPLAWKFPYATGSALKSKQNKTKQNKKEEREKEREVKVEGEGEGESKQASRHN